MSLKGEKDIFVDKVINKLPRGKKILHLGVYEDYNEGKNVHKRLKKEGFNVIGADIKKDEIVDVVCNFNEKLPFATETFEFILCMDVIEHIDNPVFFLSECYRILKHKGQIIITTPNATNIIHFMEVYKEYYPDKDRFPHIHYFDKHSLARVFRRVGFKVIETEYHSAHFNRNIFMRLLQLIVIPWRTQLLMRGEK